MIERVLDKVLTQVFKVVAPWAHKCSRCTVRARLAQLGLLVTTPVAFAAKPRRIRWESAAHPERQALTLVRLEDL